MTSPAQKECASCHGPATLVCAGCKDAPDYLPGDAPETAYCGRECQLRHREDHKRTCRTLSRRRALLRGARLLRAALLIYREAYFDVELTGIERQGDVLWLHQKPRMTPAHCVFPGHLADTPEHREAALVANQCTTAMALLGRLTKKLFPGKAELPPLPSTPVASRSAGQTQANLTTKDAPWNFHVVDLLIDKPVYRARLKPGPDSTNVPHTIIRVSRAYSDEDWVFDSAGGQYGFAEPLVPFHRYIADRKCRIVGDPTPYNATETKDLDYYATLPFMNKMRVQKLSREMERRARMHFASFVDAHAFPDVLAGSNQEIEDKMAKFKSELTSHMSKWNNK